MKNVNINIPEGYEIDQDNSDLTKGIITFKKKKDKLPITNEECVPFLPKTCYFIDIFGDIKDIPGSSGEDKNTITSKEYAEAFLALMQLVKLRDIWNEGWIADWTDGIQKYIIYFYKEKKKLSGGWQGRTVLSFKSEEIRNKFSETFDNLIQIAKPLL